MIGLAAGPVAARRLWPGRGGALPWWLALGVGTGAASLVLYAWFVAGKPGLGWLLGGESALVVAALAIPRERGVRAERPAHERLPRSIAALLAAAALSAAFGAYRTLHAYPHGEWDAVDIWNVRALSLVRGELSNVCAGQHHSDYPLLLSLVVAQLWTYLGHRLAAAMAVSLAFGAATVGLLFAAAERLVGRLAAAVLAIALLASPDFAYHAGSQRADVPLAYFALASAVCLAFYERLRAPGLLALAGVSLGAAAWTKNEGIVLAAVLVACWLATSGRRELRRAWPLAAGAAPFALALLNHKLTCGGTTDLIAAQGAQTWTRLADPSRYAAVAWGFAAHGAFYVAVAGGAALWLRRALGRPARAGGAFLAPALAAMLAIDAAVYLTTPYDLAWHLWSSLDRVLLQLWPSALFAVALRTAPAASEASSG